MSPIDKAIKLVGGLREELKEKILPLNVQTPEDFMAQAKNFESSEKVMARHRKQNESFESVELRYVFDPNGYPTIATTQSYYPSRQPNSRQNLQQSFTQQPEQRTTRARLFQREYQPSPVRQPQQATNPTPSSLQNNGRFMGMNGNASINYRQAMDYRKCFSCGEQGHLQRFCPNHLNDQQRQ